MRVTNHESIAVGHTVKRIDALGKVTGTTPYPGDIDMQGQLWMKLRYSERAHARIVAVDTRAAQALPGVVRVFTAKDVPVNEYGLIIRDQPVLCGPGSAKPGADIVRCYADYVAAVVAENESIAAAAARLIQVEYEDLPTVFDPEAAMREGAPLLHAHTPNNILSHYRIRRGDMAAGWAQADVVVEGEYHTGYQEHAYLQPEAGLGYVDDLGRVTIIVAGQWTHEDQDQVAHALGLPVEQVRIVYPAIGGAFGGREDMSVQIVLALAAYHLRRPVKIIWSREESILYHHKRHPITIHCKWGATKAGKLVAMQARVIGDVGGYAYTSTKVLGNANLMVSGPYECENMHFDTYAVYTNNIPTGAFRGFGAPQAALAAETQMNKLAQALAIDAVEIRRRNVVQEGSILSVGTPLPKGVSMQPVVEACARESGWSLRDGHFQRAATTQPDNPALRRGLGFACGFKNVGYSFGFPEQNWAAIELYGSAEIEHVVVRAGGADVGQGAHTVFVQMSAEALGVPLEKVRLITHDTAQTRTAGSASASRMTFMTGNAIRGAAAQALENWRNEDRPALATYQYRPPKTTPYDPQTGKSEPNYAYGYVAQSVELDVDIETGHIFVRRVVSVNDVGKAINPQLVEGQIEGAVVQAQGYALMENLISRQGRVLNPFLSTYLIPTVLDVPPEVKSLILEYPDPIGPWGARGVAEMPFIPLAPAIIAAFHDATGVWMHTIPLTPDRVVKALREHGLGLL
ncbi:MAG: xanthine dehydrogenase family protein [Chloroflexi bacterium]|nr:xanthine dehydrogenase family protein [Chloroflexota bacterium]